MEKKKDKRLEFYKEFTHGAWYLQQNQIDSGQSNYRHKSCVWYCRGCDRLWEITGRRKNGNIFIVHYTRDTLPFMGYIDREKRHRKCKDCDE